MGKLAFFCPETGLRIETGVETDDYTLTTVRDVKLRVSCPHCQGEHDFFVLEGHLAEAA